MDGWSKVQHKKTATEIIMTKVLSLNISKRKEKTVIDEMILEIAKHILENNLVNIEETTNPKNKEKSIKCTMNVIPPGTKYSNIVEDGFQVNNEVFTNEELIEAVRAHFPERIV